MKICNIKVFLTFLLFPLLLIRADAEDSWTLQRCIDYAIKNNPDLQAASAKIDVSAHGLDLQRKLFFPRLDLNASSGYLAGEPTSPLAVVRRVTEEGLQSRDASGQYISVELTLRVPILKEGVLFAKNAPTINIAAKQLMIDESIYEVRKNELIYNIGAAFFSLLKNKEEVGAAEEHVDYLKLVHKEALSKYSENLISKSELLLSEVKLASGEKELITARNLTQLLMAELSIKMGLEPTESLTISEEDFKQPVFPSLDKLINIALSSRYEIKAQERRVSMAKEYLRQVENQKYPDVEIVSTYAVANDYGPRTSSLWKGLFQLNMPLFDFGAVKSKIKGQKSRVIEEEKLLHSLKDNLKREVITAFINVNNARADIVYKKKIVEQSSENARLIRARFEQNLAPLPSVLKSEYILYASQKELAKAKYDLGISYLQLIKATGSKLNSPSQ